ncbi:basic amino acid ABC transporter substrate-binding protein [Ornithinimicrobium sufpigmenti]|uniref:basic amino acid ABC transporter substrate-binding protein n=1 Tax=Ornithinimicrobium sufpigmenti TaxID=2508882 RepID=UPI0010356A44|nr:MULTISPECIES: basic amino acid ABC transporter substrate-binding protein [unclassified Ornithinimicrobium]
MKMHSVTVLAAASLLTLGLTACGPDDAGEGGSGGGDDTNADPTAGSAAMDLIEDGKLAICSDAPYPPFEMEDPSSPMGWTGFDMDLMAQVAEGLELEPEVRPSSFEGLQSGLALNSGQCDIVASAMTITEDRAQNLDFTDGYYDSLQSLLVAEGSDITGIDDLAGRRVGVQQGTTGAAYAEENAPEAELVSFQNDPAMWQAIQAGQVDALLQDLPVNLEHTREGDYTIAEEYSTDEQYGFAVKKGNTGLVDAVNEQLDTMREDGRYEEIYDRYFAEDAEG